MAGIFDLLRMSGRSGVGDAARGAFKAAGEHFSDFGPDALSTVGNGVQGGIMGAPVGALYAMGADEDPVQGMIQGAGIGAAGLAALPFASHGAGAARAGLEELLRAIPAQARRTGARYLPPAQREALERLVAQNGADPQAVAQADDSVLEAAAAKLTGGQQAIDEPITTTPYAPRSRPGNPYGPRQ